MTATFDRFTSALADRYRIERELGAGGMATVYLAEDLKHKRSVALKVLHPELAAVIGAARFLSEITTTANLQHPHILPLFDSGEVLGTVFYVMPLIDGESLRDRIAREKQLPVEDAVRIAVDVAGALDYAHRHGVIHRDIKPENILLHDGRAMVADFGIALAASRTDGSTRMTETGMSLGTPHYMSPEQAMGERDLDARTDVYALGCVLYEMLAGEPPFSGPTAQAIVAKVMTSTPETVSVLRPTVPRAIAESVRVAIQRLPADRFASAAAFATALRDPMFGANRATSSAEDTFQNIRKPSRKDMALGSALLIATAVGAAGWLRSPADQPVSRFAVAVDGDIDNSPPIPSPDGSRYVTRRGDQTLWVRESDELTEKRIAADGGWSAFFSPRGDAVGYLTGFPGALRVVSLSTGSARTVVADSTFGNGGSWSADGWMYFIGGAANDMQVRRVREAGGAPEVVARLDRTRDELQFYWPQALPGGKHLLVTVYRVRGEPEVMSIDLANGNKTKLTPGIRGIFSPSGHVLVLRTDGTLVGAAFEPERAALKGPLVTLAEGLTTKGDIETFFVSGVGTLTYQTAGQNHQVVRVTRDGVEHVVDGNWTGRFRSLDLSSDATKLAISIEIGGRFELWIKTLPDGPLTRMSYDGFVNYRPKWYAGDRSILFTSDRSGQVELYSIAADASSEATLVRSDPMAIDEGEFSADGKWLVYRSGSGGHRDVYAVGLGSDTARISIATTEYEEASPTLSPDSRAVAYVSNESGRDEVYVRPFPNVSAARVQISSDGGREPTWSHDSKELFYRNAAGDLIAAVVASTADLRISTRRKLFSMQPYAEDKNNRMITVAPDNQSFYLVRQSVPNGKPAQMIVVQNWFGELKTRIRAGK